MNSSVRFRKAWRDIAYPAAMQLGAAIRAAARLDRSQESILEPHQVPNGRRPWATDSYREPDQSEQGVVLARRDQQEDVGTHYDEATWNYPFYSGNTLGMHYGLWNNGCTSLREALLAANDLVIELGQIGANDVVVDAGSGVGGTAIHVAEKTGAKVHGLSITASQGPKSVKNAEVRGAEVSERVSFVTADYLHMPFPDESVDVVYALESACYADPKSAFLAEAFRVLRPGGRLVVVDGYASRGPKNPEEEELVQNFLDAWSIPVFTTPDVISHEAFQAGFEDVQYRSLYAEVVPSIDYLDKQGRGIRRLGAHHMASITAKLRLRRLHALYRGLSDNITAITAVGDAFRIGGATYGCHSAVKPQMS